MAIKEIMATTIAFSTCENRCVAPRVVLRFVLTNTPVGGMEPATPQTMWPMIKPRNSSSSLNERSTRDAAIFAEMRVSSTATMATENEGRRRSTKDADMVDPVVKGPMMLGSKTPYLLFSVNNSTSILSTSWKRKPIGIEKRGRSTVQGILGIFRIKNHSKGAWSTKRTRDGHFISWRVMMDSQMFWTTSLCLTAGDRPNA